MQLQSKANFTLFLQLNCPNFRLKECNALLLLKLPKKLSLKESGVSYNQKKVFRDDQSQNI